MYRLILESLLGLRLIGGAQSRLQFAPCLPADWQGFQVQYRYRETLYRINLRQIPGANAAMSVRVDGVTQSEPAIPLADDRRDHLVEVTVVVKKAIEKQLAPVDG